MSEKWKKAIEAAERLQKANESGKRDKQKEEHETLMLCLLAILLEHKKDA